MRPTFAAAVVLALALGAAPARADMTSSLDSLMVSSNWGFFGAALAVRHDTTLVYSRAVAPMTLDSRIYIASASKWLSCAAFMTLVDQGIVHLDDPVSAWLPRFTGQKGTITVRQLWSHMSGLPGASPYVTDNTLTLAQAADSIALRTPLDRAPGSAFAYGEVGMQVAGRIAEVASGLPWETFVRQRLTAPLGMANTDYNAVSNPQIGAGALSTARDYSRFTAMVAEGGHFGATAVLSAAALQAMQHDQVAPMPIAYSPYQGSFTPDVHYGLGEWLTIEDYRTLQGVLESSQGAFGFSPWSSPCAGIGGALAVFSDPVTASGPWVGILQIVGTYHPDPCVYALVDAPPGTPDAGVTLALASPNPVRGPVVLRFTLPAAGHATVDVLDAAGARVARLADAAYGAGGHALLWDAARVAPGAYWARLDAGGTRRVVRITRLR